MKKTRHWSSLKLSCVKPDSHLLGLRCTTGISMRKKLFLTRHSAAQESRKNVHICASILKFKKNHHNKMNDDEAVIFLSYILLKRSFRRKNKEKENAQKKRSTRVREIYRRRNDCGLYHTLVQEMALGDRKFYFK